MRWSAGCKCCADCESWIAYLAIFQERPLAFVTFQISEVLSHFTVYNQGDAYVEGDFIARPNANGFSFYVVLENITSTMNTDWSEVVQLVRHDFDTLAELTVPIAGKQTLPAPWVGRRLFKCAMQLLTLGIDTSIDAEQAEFVATVVSTLTGSASRIRLRSIVPDIPLPLDDVEYESLAGVNPDAEFTLPWADNTRLHHNILDLWNDALSANVSTVVLFVDYPPSEPIDGGMIFSQPKIMVGPDLPVMGSYTPQMINATDHWKDHLEFVGALSEPPTPGVLLAGEKYLLRKAMPASPYELAPRIVFYDEQDDLCTLPVAMRLEWSNTAGVFRKIEYEMLGGRQKALSAFPKIVGDDEFWKDLRERVDQFQELADIATSYQNQSQFASMTMTNFLVRLFDGGYKPTPPPPSYYGGTAATPSTLIEHTFYHIADPKPPRLVIAQDFEIGCNTWNAVKDFKIHVGEHHLVPFDVQNPGDGRPFYDEIEFFQTDGLVLDRERPWEKRGDVALQNHGTGPLWMRSLGFASKNTDLCPPQDYCGLIQETEQFFRVKVLASFGGQTRAITLYAQKRDPNDATTPDGCAAASSSWQQHTFYDVELFPELGDDFLFEGVLDRSEAIGDADFLQVDFVQPNDKEWPEGQTHSVYVSAELLPGIPDAFGSTLQSTATTTRIDAIFPNGALVGKWITILNGNGEGQQREIVANVQIPFGFGIAVEVEVADWDVIPDQNSAYMITDTSDPLFPRIEVVMQYQRERYFNDDKFRIPPANSRVRYSEMIEVTWNQPVGVVLNRLSDLPVIDLDSANGDVLYRDNAATASTGTLQLVADPAGLVRSAGIPGQGVPLDEIDFSGMLPMSATITRCDDV